MQALVILKPLPQANLPQDGSLDYLFGAGPLAATITQTGVLAVGAPYMGGCYINRDEIGSFVWATDSFLPGPLNIDMTVDEPVEVDFDCISELEAFALCQHLNISCPIKLAAKE